MAYSTWYVSTRTLQNMISGIPLYWAWQPECEILLFTWSFGPLGSTFRLFSREWGSEQLEPAGDAKLSASDRRTARLRAVLLAGKLHKEPALRLQIEALTLVPKS